MLSLMMSRAEVNLNKRIDDRNAAKNLSVIKVFRTDPESAGLFRPWQ